MTWTDVKGSKGRILLQLNRLECAVLGGKNIYMYLQDRTEFVLFSLDSFEEADRMYQTIIEAARGEANEH